MSSDNQVAQAKTEKANAVSATRHILLKCEPGNDVQESLTALEASMRAKNAPKSIKSLCAQMEQEYLDGPKVACTIMRHYLPCEAEESYENFASLIREAALVGGFIDTLVDLKADYHAGIAPAPTLKNQLYVVLRLAQHLFWCAAYLPITKETVYLLTHFVLSAYSITLDKQS